MKVLSNKNQDFLVRVIDKLAPLNNKFRTVKDPMEKIETLWDIGKIIDVYLSQYDLKLHELLYQIYDPHSTIKRSYITRDLGSYSYRVFKYFKSKDEIRRRLAGLESYTLFREAIPLLFNEKYNLNNKDKDKIIKIITFGGDQKLLIAKIRKKKKKILPISNPRDQKSREFKEEKLYLQNLLNKLKEFYAINKVLPDKLDILEYKKNREIFVMLLMALASDSFLNKIEHLDTKIIDNNQKRLLSIVKSSNINRARFRKWVMNSTELLKIAEAIYSLNNKKYYINFRNKFINGGTSKD